MLINHRTQSPEFISITAEDGITAIKVYDHGLVIHFSDSQTLEIEADLKSVRTHREQDGQTWSKDLLAQR